MKTPFSKGNILKIYFISVILIASVINFTLAHHPPLPGVSWVSSPVWVMPLARHVCSGSESSSSSSTCQLTGARRRSSSWSSLAATLAGTGASGGRTWPGSWRSGPSETWATPPCWTDLISLQVTVKNNSWVYAFSQKWRNSTITFYNKYGW